MLRHWQKKNKEHNKYFSRSSSIKKYTWKDVQLQVQRAERHLRKTWWEEQAKDTQACADYGRMQAFCAGFRKIVYPLHNNFCTIKDSDDIFLLKCTDKILKRWASYYTAILNINNGTGLDAIEELTRLPIMPKWTLFQIHKKQRMQSKAWSVV